MFDLHIERKENGIYEVGYKTYEMREAFKICDVLESLNENELQATYEVLEKKEEDIEDTKIDDCEYDIKTNAYIYKKDEKAIKKNENQNKIDFNICPLEPFKNTGWALVPTVRLKIFYKESDLQNEYKEAILKEWEKRGENKNELISNDAIVDNNKSDITNREEVELKKAEINKKIEAIKRGRDLFSLSDSELKQIAEIDIFDNTAQSILKGREFNSMKELEREKEKQELKEDENGIINFGEDTSEKIKKENSETDDPLSKNADGWGAEDLKDGEYMFADDEEDEFHFA